MAVSNQYVAHAVECMARVAPVSYRRIFHGVGVYHQGQQFALIVNDRVYFRADEQSAILYEQRAMSVFCPSAAQRADVGFYHLPEEILANPAELIHWLRIAVEAAQNASSMENISPVESTLSLADVSAQDAAATQVNPGTPPNPSARENLSGKENASGQDMPFIEAPMRQIRAI